MRAASFQHQSSLNFEKEKHQEEKKRAFEMDHEQKQTKLWNEETPKKLNEIRNFENKWIFEM